MAAEFDATEFVDSDFQAAHKAAYTGAAPASGAVNRAPSREEVDSKVGETHAETRRTQTRPGRTRTRAFRARRNPPPPDGISDRPAGNHPEPDARRRLAGGSGVRRAPRRRADGPVPRRHERRARQSREHQRTELDKGKFQRRTHARPDHHRKRAHGMEHCPPEISRSVRRRSRRGNRVGRRQALRRNRCSPGRVSASCASSASR